MNMKKYMLLVAMLFTAIIASVPSAQAGRGCCGAKVYSSEDGRYYQIPYAKSGGVYRSVDGTYYPVMTSSCKKYKHHRMTRSVAVTCQSVPAHWMYGHWYPTSKACWYHVR